MVVLFEAVHRRGLAHRDRAKSIVVVRFLISQENSVKSHRRNFFRLAATATAVLTLSPVAKAQSYPSRPVHLLVGFAVGGPLDTSARLIAQWLSKRLGQSFIVENRPGAGSNLATAIVVRAPPDGYTLLEISASNAWNATLYENLKFSFVHDIVPVAGVRRASGVMEVHPSVPVTTIPEFIAYAKANPGKINMATGGVGSAPHLYGELFKVMAGVDLLTVNYRGSAPALSDLIAGHDQVMFDVLLSSIGPIRAGKLRPLGVTTATRLDALPDVPPIGDLVPGFEASSWDGIGAPANTPPEIIAMLNREVNAALVDPSFKARLADLGADPFANSPAEFGSFIAEFTEKWAKVIRAARIKAE
jgi:tripartite-type tricarboxylate transporter receptor subunit TctC